MADKFQLKAILSAVDKISPVLKNVNRATKLTYKSIRDIGNAGGELMRKIGLPAFASFTAIAYAALGAARAAMTYSGSIQDASERTGAGVESYQALTNMLGQVGGSAEDAEMSFTKFNKGVADAAAGADKSFAGLMRKLKIPLKDAEGNLISLTAALPDLAAAFEKNSDPAKRTRMAMELFGKGGSKMIPILMKGREAVADWIKEQERLGAIISKDSVAALDDLGDAHAGLTTQIRANIANALAKVVPILKPIISSMSEWLAANKEWLQTQIVGTITEISQALRNIDWKGVAQDIRSTATIVANVVRMLGGLKGVILGLGLAFLAGPLAAILSIGGAIIRLGVGLVSILGPWAILAAAVAGIGYLIYKNWGSIGPTIMSSLSPLMGSLSGLGTSIKSMFASLMELHNLLAPVMVPVLKVLAFLVGQVLLLAFEAVARVLDGVVIVIKEAIDFGTQFLKLISNIINGIGSIAHQVMPSWFGGDGAGGGTGSKAPANASPIVGPGKQQLNGEMTVRFENAPPGMRVDQGKTNQSGVSLNPDVGYRSPVFAL